MARGTHQDRAVTASQARSHLFASWGQCLIIPPQRRCPFAADTSHEGHTVMFSPYVHKTPRSGSSLVTFSSQLSHLVFITDAATEAKTVPGSAHKGPAELLAPFPPPPPSQLHASEKRRGSRPAADEIRPQQPDDYVALVSATE